MKDDDAPHAPIFDLFWMDGQGFQR